MIFTPTPLPGAYLIELERRGDERGFFARTFCNEEFAAHGLVTVFVQANTSLSAQQGTLRGLHLQRPPAEETKLMRCIQGAMWDVIVDMRLDSATYGQSFGAELSAENGRQMYVPKGFAHGFLTLKPDTIAAYMVDAPYTPGVETGLRWDDPGLNIVWPIAPTLVSEKDQTWPLLETKHKV
ncbi:MAG: dTDP-4-dehydrorhamnose 3,5-epimerase [Pseudomonadota bacterium]